MYLTPQLGITVNLSSLTEQTSKKEGDIFNEYNTRSSKKCDFKDATLNKLGINGPRCPSD